MTIEEMAYELQRKFSENKLRFTVGFFDTSRPSILGLALYHPSRKKELALIYFTSLPALKLELVDASIAVGLSEDEKKRLEENLYRIAKAIEDNDEDSFKNNLYYLASL